MYTYVIAVYQMHTMNRKSITHKHCNYTMHTHIHPPHTPHTYTAHPPTPTSHPPTPHPPSFPPSLPPSLSLTHTHTHTNTHAHTHTHTHKHTRAHTHLGFLLNMRSIRFRKSRLYLEGTGGYEPRMIFSTRLRMLPASNWTCQGTRVGERETGDTCIHTMHF